MPYHRQHMLKYIIFSYLISYNHKLIQYYIDKKSSQNDINIR